MYFFFSYCGRLYFYGTRENRLNYVNVVRFFFRTKLQLFEHICTHMQVYIIFNNFHPFDFAPFFSSINVCFYLFFCVCKRTLHKKTFGHFLNAIHFLFIILMHYNHIYYLSFRWACTSKWNPKQLKCWTNAIR